MSNSTVKYHFEESLVARQTKAEAAMLAEFEAGSYTLEHPLVKLNPYFISPLSAVVLFETEMETAVTVTVKGKEPEGTIKHTFPPAKRHILPILGLYPDYENEVELRLYRGASSTITIPTAPLEGNFPKLISMETTPS